LDKRQPSFLRPVYDIKVVFRDSFRQILQSHSRRAKPNSSKPPPVVLESRHYAEETQLGGTVSHQGG
jgi:hypothetical protein